MSVALGSSVPILLSVMLARTLKVEDFGVWTLFVATYGFCRSVLTVGLTDAMRSYFAGLQLVRIEERLISGWVVSVLMGLVASMGVLGCWVAECFMRPPYSLTFFLLAIIIAVFEGMLTQLMAVVQFVKGAREYLAQTVFTSLITLSLCGVGVFLSARWESAVAGRIVGYFFAIGMGAVFVLKMSTGWWRGWTTVVEESKVLLRQGYRHIPFEIRMVSIPFILRLSLSVTAGFVPVAQFGVASLFGAVISLIAIGMILYMQPVITQLYRNGDSHLIGSVLKHSACFLGAILSSIFLIEWCAPFLIPHILGESYGQSITMLLPVLLLYGLFSLLDFAQALLQCVGKAHSASIGNVAIVFFIGFYGLVCRFSTVEEMVYVVLSITMPLAAVAAFIVNKRASEGCG